MLSGMPVSGEPITPTGIASPDAESAADSAAANKRGMKLEPAPGSRFPVLVYLSYFSGYLTPPHCLPSGNREFDQTLCHATSRAPLFRMPGCDVTRRVILRWGAIATAAIPLPGAIDPARSYASTCAAGISAVVLGYLELVTLTEDRAAATWYTGEAGTRTTARAG